VAIALTGEIASAGALGYGGQLLAARGRHDDQRGELVFVLRDAVSGVERELSTRLVTRAFPDPASEVGLRNQVSPATAGFGIAQLLAIVDVPSSVPAGTYDMSVRRRRRTDAGGSEALPAPLYAQRFVVLPANIGGVVGAPTPATSEVGPISTDVSEELTNLVPLPKVVLALPASAPPHAAHLVVAYPRTKITPRGVIEEQHLGRGSIVSWSDDPGSGRVTIDLVDPAASVHSLAFIFEPKAPLSAGRIVLSEVSLVSTVLYDRNGAVRSGTVTPIAIR
jgi:hypothetical protein